MLLVANTILTGWALKDYQGLRGLGVLKCGLLGRPSHSHSHVVLLLENTILKGLGSSGLRESYRFGCF